MHSRNLLWRVILDKLSNRLIVYLVGGAAIFVILFGIRGSAYIINPILLAAVITITVLPIPSRLTKRGLPGWLSLVLTILMVVLILGLVIATVFFSVTKLIHRAAGLYGQCFPASQRGSSRRLEILRQVRKSSR